MREIDSHIPKTVPTILDGLQQGETLTLYDIPIPIREKIEHSNNNTNTSYYRIPSPENDRTFHIYIWGFGKTGEAKAIRAITTYLHFISPYCPPTCRPDLNIYIYGVSLKKRLPKRGVTIDTIHANTAVTQGCHSGKNGEIIIFRKEEWFKVLIHETFHALGLDFSNVPPSHFGRVNSMLSQLYSIPFQDFHLYESYCELYATILNVLFYVAWHPSTSSSLEKKLIQYCFFQEMSFSLFQWKKILNHAGNGTSLDTHYSEKTSVLSYYGLKSVGLFYLDDFMKKYWLSRPLNPFAFANSSIHSYCVFFKERCFQRDYIQSLEKKRNFPADTMRMTLVDSFLQ
jgi:hypothetical protein